MRIEIGLKIHLSTKYVDHNASAFFVICTYWTFQDFMLTRLSQRALRSCNANGCTRRKKLCCFNNVYFVIQLETLVAKAEDRDMSNVDKYNFCQYTYNKQTSCLRNYAREGSDQSELSSRLWAGRWSQT